MHDTMLYEVISTLHARHNFLELPRNCEKFFHYECAFKSKELKKMKIHLKGHDLESYGCSCTSHDGKLSYFGMPADVSF
jgi:hypothetical protein